MSASEAKRGSLFAIVLTIAMLTGVAAADAYVYWGHQLGAIGRADLDGGDANRNFLPTGAPQFQQSIALDADHLYWVDFDDGSIGRSDLDGEGSDREFMDDLLEPISVAVDDRHIYWSNREGMIGRANLDGTDVVEDFIQEAGEPRELAIDDRFIYWASSYPSHAIGRASKDGANVDPAFIRMGDIVVEDVAVDDEHVYWSTDDAVSSVMAIGRANLDGSNFKPGFIAGVAAGGIAIDGEHIYWANRNRDGTDSVARAELDGTRPDLGFIGATGGAVAVAVDGLGPRSEPETPQAPETRLNGFTIKHRKRTVRLRFSASTPSARFRCSLDRGGFRPCSSPKTYRGLDRGRHLFKVKARFRGETDPTPVKQRFRIRRR